MKANPSYLHVHVVYMMLFDKFMVYTCLCCLFVFCRKFYCASKVIIEATTSVVRPSYHKTWFARLFAIAMYRFCSLNFGPDLGISFLLVCSKCDCPCPCVRACVGMSTYYLTYLHPGPPSTNGNVSSYTMVHFVVLSSLLVCFDVHIEVCSPNVSRKNGASKWAFDISVLVNVRWHPPCAPLY